MSHEQASDSLVIAIDGPAGAGKTHIAKQIGQYWSLDHDRQIIHGDHYFEPADRPGVEAVAGTPGGFNPDRFMRQVGRAINDPAVAFQVEEYDWQTDSYVPRPAPDRRQKIVAEGIKLIGLPINWGLKVWVDVPYEVRKQRFVARRLEDRRMRESDQAALLDRFELWQADAERYTADINPHGRLDIVVVDGALHPDNQLAIIAAAVNDVECP
ncbi:MAG TPA: hypothetical protein VHC21_04590 [Candidatus Saccharimonadales bacterium]|nr:hypothetical protein [Candidatus Saccharimonadales bacterium]